MTPHARHTDTETSHIAAASVKTSTVKLLQESILKILEEYFPQGLTDEELYAEVDTLLLIGRGWLSISGSSLRTRRRELVDEGLIEAVPDERARTNAGRPCHTWRLVKETRLFT